MYNSDFNDYINNFVQRQPKYAVKHSSRNRWSTKNKPLADKPILAHLDGEYDVGVLSQWYPGFAVLDIDDAPMDHVDEIRDKLGLHENNSMLFASESDDSYHLIIKPSLNGNPPTVKRLQSAFKMFAIEHNCEIYPQSNRVIRLPFGKHHRPIDPQYYNLQDWHDGLYWFNKLDEFDLASVEGQQCMFDLHTDPVVVHSGIIQQAKELLENGLQMSSTRHESQFKILYYLWRQNISQDQAESIVFDCIKKKHNGFSKTIGPHPEQVRQEIRRQASHIYSKYDLSYVYPDVTHNMHNGFITEPDMQDIIRICSGSLPRMRFLFKLVAYSYPRQYRNYIGVHRDKLVDWSSERTYQKYLDELQIQGIAIRGKSYSCGSFSKNINLDWNYHNATDAILYEGRALSTFDEAVRLIMPPAEFRELLYRSGKRRSTTSMILKKIYSDNNDN